MRKYIAFAVDLINRLCDIVIQAATKTASTGDKTMNQRIALLLITIGLLIAGWMDGQDAKLMEAKPLIVSCVSCAGGAR